MVTTRDETPPKFIAMTPRLKADGGSKATLTIGLNEMGVIYWLMQKYGSSKPSRRDVLNGISAGSW
eukprot:2087898-Ditylum_brightwellii.AAC.1